MEKTNVIDALAALAQENRLDTYRLLVQAGPDGISAGEIAASLGLPPNTLSFHFDRLRQAGLVTVRRNGRSMIYAARYDTMNALIGFLTEKCCAGQAVSCAPANICEISPTAKEAAPCLPVRTKSDTRSPSLVAGPSGSRPRRT